VERAQGGAGVEAASPAARRGPAIAASLPDAAVLARELADFRVRYTDAGNAQFSARKGAHDDLVLALALAVFGLSRAEPVRDVEVIRAR
jgi:hypothetical protein